jgi:branched-chain amino acid transport system ATP-binding protein
VRITGQQILAIARALLSKPKLLLLDEPSLGLAPKMADFVFEMVVRLRDEGLTVLLIEQKARQALKIAGHAFLMETGRILFSGRSQDLLEDQILSKTFLGASAIKP